MDVSLVRDGIPSERLGSFGAKRQTDASGAEGDFPHEADIARKIPVSHPSCNRTALYDILSLVSTNGEVAQLVEHHVRNVGVESSNLFFSTNFVKRRSGSRQSDAPRFFLPAAIFCL